MYIIKNNDNNLLIKFNSNGEVKHTANINKAMLFKSKSHANQYAKDNNISNIDLINTIHESLFLL